jgi:hypothetical protein
MMVTHLECGWSILKFCPEAQSYNMLCGYLFQSRLSCCSTILTNMGGLDDELSAMSRYVEPDCVVGNDRCHFLV